MATLKGLITQRPGFADSYFLLAEIHLQQGERQQAEAVLQQALQVESLSLQDRARIAAIFQRLSNPEPPKYDRRGNR